MAGNSSVGGLRIDLSLGTGQFNKDISGAQASLKAFGIVAGTVAASVTAAFAAVTTAAVKVTADIEKVSDAAQGLGVAVESLSALRYAAQQSGVSFETLTSAMGKLNSMSDTTRYAFEALGIAVEKANGDSKSADVLLTELAGKFAGAANDASKAQAAINLFGEELGPKLVPLLNQGVTGLEDLRRKASELGLTIGDEMSEKASKFQIAWKGIGDQMDSVARRVVEPFLPMLTSLANRISNVVSIMGDWAAAAARVAANWLNLTRVTEASNQKELEAALADTTVKLQEHQAKLTDAADRVDSLKEGTHAYAAALRYLQTLQAELIPIESERARVLDLLAQAQAKAAGAAAAPSLPSTSKPDEEGGGGGGGGGSWASTLERANSAFLQFMGMQDPLQASFERLNKFYMQGALSAEQMTQAIEMLNKKQGELRFNEAISGTGKLLGALGQLFDGNKAFAIGQAAIDAYTSFNAALKNPPGPPYTIPAAAAALASGLAQVRSIMSTKPGSAGGGSSSAAAAGQMAAGQQAAAPEQRSTMYVQGLDPTALYTGDAIRQIVGGIEDFTRNGGSVYLGNAA